MRRVPLLAALLGVALLAAGLVVTTEVISQARQQHKRLERDAAMVSSSFSAYFERARSLDLLLAQHPAFARPTLGAADRDTANEALRYLEVLFPGAIGEACLIDEDGRELARVTEGHPAAEGELSSAEANNDFFAATMALGPGQVHQAPPYISPDTHRWVISNSTWIRRADGSRVIVHFEISLASFGEYVATSDPRRHVSVVDSRTGQVLLGSRTDLPGTEPAEPSFPVTPWSAALTSAPSSTREIDVGGQRAAVQRVPEVSGNANHWYVVEWSSAQASLLPVWAGAAGTLLGVFLIFVALASLRRQQTTLRAAARLDHLTGLANRKALEEALEEALDAATQPGSDRVAVLMLDLDGFKQVNDTLGHDTGDSVLQEIARRLHTNVFEYDTAARMGGDEFAVVLRRLREADDVEVVAHRLREALVRPIRIDGTPRFVGVSIGAAVHREHGGSPSELLRAADAAMYQAKRAKEGVRVYSAGTADGASALGLAAELLSAIEDEDLTLVFQPEFSLTTDEIVGVEALARWDRQGHGPVPPTEFILLAEETGLIRSLTHLTLRLALDQAQVWASAGIHVPVSVNLSGQMAADRSLPAEVTALLEQRGLSGEVLVLEITETAVIGDGEAAVGVLQRLRSLGVRIELDDFGSGYASFRTLHDLPLDGVKIDGELVGEQRQGEPRLLSATIEIARRLGLKVVAEGIEDAATLELVRRLGCDTAQGNHLAAPMTASMVRPLLERAAAVARN